MGSLSTVTTPFAPCCRWTLDQYISARNGLIEKDLIAFDGTVFQVLELPATCVSASQDGEQMRAKNQATIAQLADQSLKRMER